MLPDFIEDGWINVAYSRDSNRQTPDLRTGFPGAAYFVPGEPWTKGQWVRLVFKKRQSRGEPHFICVGELESATDAEAHVVKIEHESGTAPRAFMSQAWTATVQPSGGEWHVVELQGRRDEGKDRRSLEEAIRKGNSKAVLHVIDDGVSMETRLEHEMTPLMYAARLGHDGLVKDLLDRGANIQAHSLAGSLYEVARRGKASLELLQFLREHGAVTPEIKKQPIAPNSATGFEVGASVTHPKFGGGHVVGSDGSGDSLKVTVTFADGTTRALLAKFLTR